MRNKFDQQLHLLEEQLTHMGELCETAIAKATQALKDGSIEQAKIIIEEDEEIAHATCRVYCPGQQAGSTEVSDGICSHAQTTCR